jgi:hypothetical protein
MPRSSEKDAYVGIGSEPESDSEESDAPDAPSSRFFKTIDRETALEGNVFGFLALSMIQTPKGKPISKGLSKVYMWFLLLCGMALQAVFVLYMLPAISADEIKTKVDVNATNFAALERGERVCAMSSDIVDYLNLSGPNIPFGQCGIYTVAKVDSIANIVYFKWDNNQSSWLPQNSRIGHVSREIMGVVENDTESNAFKMWREDPDGGAGKSWGYDWAGWACNGKDWSWEESQIGNYDNYKKPLEKIDFFGWKKDLKVWSRFRVSNGKAFGLIALFLWSSAIVKGIRDAFEYGFLAHCTTEIVQSLTVEDLIKGDTLAEETGIMTTCAKISVLLVGLIRITLLALLCRQGVQFLSHTDNLKDFVLNSLALGFVMDIPSTLFSSFATYTERAAIDDFNEKNKITSKETVFWSFISGFIWVLLGALIVIVGAYHDLFPFAEQLDSQVYQRLCNATVMPQ